MKRFLSAVGLCIFLLLFGLFVFLPTTTAEKNLLESLLRLPAPPPPNPLIINNRTERGIDFYNKNKPPSDDAPIDDLVAYWQNINQINQKLTYSPKASEKTLNRLMDEIERKPEILPSLLNNFTGKKDAADFVKRLYDREMSEKKFERDWRESVKRWLTYNSEYFSNELLRQAEQAGDAGEYISNQEELLALARVDWEKARPILERLMNDPSQPISQTLARWAFYERAVREKDSIEAEKYRRELQKTVENKSEKPGNRDLAMDALVETGDFQGRDEWYFSLLEDETLHDLRVNGTTYTGLTTMLNHSPSDKYTAKMLELLKSGNAAVRSAAVRNLSTLLGEKNREVVEALLPWLENPAWAKETSGERRNLIAALREFAIPESVPGLIAVLNEKQSQEVSAPSTNANLSNVNSMSRGSGEMTTVNYYPYRDEAIGALTTQKDMRAITPLRMILPLVEEWQRASVVQALLASRGFAVSEQVAALESVAKSYGMSDSETDANTAANKMPILPVTDDIINSLTPRPFDPAEIKTLLGTQLINQTEAEEELVTALIQRIEVLDMKDPQTAYGLRKIMQNWNGTAVNRLLLKDLKNNKADTDSIVKLLSLRKELREKQPDDVYDARGGSPTALGIAACLLENNGEYDALLAAENVEAKTAMLGCARLIRASLPIQKVAENLKHPNRTLVRAAELYLASEDSPEARQIILSFHPNEAKILGARTYFAGEEPSSVNSAYLPALFASVNETLPSSGYYIYYGVTESLIDTEKRLQREVKENQELLGVYAYNDNFVRIYKDKAVFSWQEDKARYRERILENEEFETLKNYLAAERVNEFPPFLSDCEGECEGKELLMLGRHGGRRVFSLSSPQPKFFAGLDTIFGEMRQPPAKLHYWLEKNIAGLEILFEDENLQAEALWKLGDDFRVLINNQVRRKEIDKEIEQQEEAEEEKLTGAETEQGYEKFEKMEELRRKRREQREYENYTWYKFAGGKLAGTTEQPNGIEFVPKIDVNGVRPDNDQWKARTTTFEIRGNSEGLFKITGGRTNKIRSGYYEKTVVTPNGRWAVATYYGEEEGRQLIRLNLLTNKQIPVVSEDFQDIRPLGYIPTLNRFLLLNSEYSEHEMEEADVTEKEGEFFLLDVETGAIQRTKAELRPLAQQTFRPLQPTGKNDEVWAAIPDAKKNETQVGVYNIRTLAFKPLVKIPEITFNSMQMWIDAGRIYFVYRGHVLNLPIGR